MPILLAGVLVLLMLLSALGRLSRSRPKMAQRISRFLAVVLVPGTLKLLLRQHMPAGMGPFAAGAFSFGKRQDAAKDGRWSQARTAFIAIRLDHDTGAIEGQALGGGFAGRSLASLSLAQALALLGACRQQDPDGARLLETYLDRRFSAWRQAEQSEADGGLGRAGGGAMSRQQAYQTLGLRDGASSEDITRAHRDLMKKFHPDRGGSTAQAALVNQAKDVLLTRHGTP
jgi:DnaJ domain